MAVKIYKKSNLKRIDYNLIENEILILKQIKNQNILELDQIYENSHYICLITELLEEGDLFQNYEENFEKKKHNIKENMRQLLEALSCLEELGIMHRDLKPENILFKPKSSKHQKESQIKLIDFGFAEFDARNDPFLIKCGTRGYIAPEVLKSSETNKIVYNEKCDIFSAGVIFYQMLTEGKLPFDQEDYKEEIEEFKKLAEDYTFEHEECIISNYGEEALLLLNQMLAFEPLKRPGAKELLKSKFFVSITNKESFGELSNWTTLDSVKNLVPFSDPIIEEDNSMGESCDLDDIAQEPPTKSLNQYVLGNFKTKRF